MKNKTYSNFFRVDGNKTFVELVPFAFSIGKLQFNFCEYNDSNVMTKKLTVYLEITEALVLANYILSGRLDRIINEAKQTGQFEGKNITPYTSFYTILGGTIYKGKADKFKSDKEKYPWLTSEDDCISKQFKVLDSTKYKYLLKAEYGLGKQNAQGLIVPQGQAKTYVQVPVTQEQAIAMAEIIKMNVQAYYTMFYMKFADTLFPNLECNLFKADSSYNKNNTNSAPQNQKSEKVDNTTENKAVENEQPKQTTSAPAKATVPQTQAMVVISNGKLTPYPDNETKFAIKAKREDNGNALNIVFMEEYYKDCERWEELKNALSSGKTAIKVRMNLYISEQGIGYFTSLAS